jgi:hypothetical protein
MESSVAEAFDLGTVTRPARRLRGRSDAHVWALDTDRGQWVAKLQARVPPAGDNLEWHARAAGVTTAPPVLPVTPVPGARFWASTPVGPARVWRRLTGAQPAVPADRSVAAWLGHSIATMASLRLPAAPVQASEVDCVGLEKELAAAVREMEGILREARPHRPTVVLSHRDISRRNVLVTGDGPVLLDFDHAGPQAPWWELVHHSFLLSCHDLGREEPDPTTIGLMVEAYADAGGEVGPADLTAYGGLLGGLLDWVAASVGTGDVQALRQAEQSLPLVARSLERWTALLR